MQIHLIAKFFDDLEVVRTVRFVKYQSLVANLDDQIGILTGTVGEVLENRKRRILNPHIVSRRPTERDEGGTELVGVRVFIADTYFFSQNVCKIRWIVLGGSRLIRKVLRWNICGWLLLKVPEVPSRGEDFVSCKESSCVIL